MTAGETQHDSVSAYPHHQVQHRDDVFADVRFESGQYFKRTRNHKLMQIC